MNYFTDCHTLDDIRIEYHRLAKLHHPDLGGDTATMQAINTAYADALAYVASNTQRTRREQARTEGKRTAYDTVNLDEVQEVLRQKIAAILHCEGLEIEICGLWVWVTGNTRPHKDTLKAAGYRWSHEKTAWYYPATPSSSRGGFTLDDIRSAHGSRRVNTHREPAPIQLTPA